MESYSNARSIQKAKLKLSYALLSEFGDFVTIPFFEKFLGAYPTMKKHVRIWSETNYILRGLGEQK